jgi:hypothetical protein
MRNRTRLLAASVVLALAQIVHAATPVGTEGESLVGPIVGLGLLIASIVAAVGAFRGAAWAPRLTLVTGALVAGGFVLYHAIPVHSPVTNPYPGEPVGGPAWVSVALAVAAGVWAAFEGWRARPHLTERSPEGSGPQH